MNATQLLLEYAALSKQIAELSKRREELRGAIIERATDGKLSGRGINAVITERHMPERIVKAHVQRVIKVA